MFNVMYVMCVMYVCVRACDDIKMRNNTKC